ncbi:MAG: hypothetical protein JKY52_17825 [Flavobacteriales bacterium]|nr:hypothetical protein [Flavobacteriales bacterium]
MRSVLISIALILVTVLCCAQNGSWTMVIDGRVTEGSKKLEKAIITLTKNGVFEKKTRSASNGKFSLVLLPENEYLIEISKDGYVAKRIAVSTTGVPEEKVGQGFPAFPVEIDIFRQMEGLDTEILDKPVGKIKYYDKADEFDFDKVYVRQIKAKLDKLTREAQRLAAAKEAKEKRVAEAAARKKAAAEAAAQAKAAAEAKAQALAEKKKVAAEVAAKEKAEAAAKTAAKEKAAAEAKAQAETLAKKQAELDKQYNASIWKGDVALGKKDYTYAANMYKKALGLKPELSYPQDKLDQIKEEQLLAERERAEKEAARLKAEADAAAEADAKAKLEAEAKENAKRESELKKIEDGYNAAIFKGDQYFNAKKYTEAVTAFQQALTAKPQASYPQNKIAEIDAIVAGDEKAKLEVEKRLAEIDEKYKVAVENGNKSMKFKKFGEAQTFYSQAAGLKPNEKYPKEKLSEIERILVNEKRKEEIAAKINYDAKIREADDAFSAREYSLSKEKYQEALVLMPDKKFPKDKLLELEELIEAEEKSKQEAEARTRERSEKYLAVIAEADNALAANNFSDAKRSYQEALGMKRDEAYPKNQIALIEEKIEEQRIRKANEAKRLEEKKASAAQTAKQKAREKQYKAVLADADKAFRNRDVIALSLYRQASSIKPDVQYPKDKIAEINAIMRGNKKTDVKYDKALANGASLLSGKKYKSAIQAYESALLIKPEEEYPKRKIQEIKEIMAKLEKRKEAAKQAKKEADATRKAEALKRLQSEKERKGQAPDEKAEKDKENGEMNASERARHIREMQEEAHKGMNDEERQRYLGEVALEYPSGLTEERYMDGKKKILLRIIVEDGHADMYKMVIQPWGQTFWFKNGQITTKFLWESESDPN